ncbi:MAG: DUF1460 domain-containing protein [Prevotella sp.]|nr:DUF1460 domain-containing protein [Prevotella sp.]
MRNRWKSIILGAVMSLMSLSAQSQTVHYEAADSSFVCRMLSEARQLPRTTNFVLFFANELKGRPYVAHTLELFDEERLIVNTRQLDCTTLVETVTALTLCAHRNLYTFRDFLNALMSLRYRGGRLDGYPSRLHYFSDWIADKTAMGLVEEQQQNPPFTAVQTLDIHYMSRHPQAYRALQAHPEFVPLIARQERALTGKQYRYLPKAELQDTELLRRTIRDGDIIAITCSKPGLDIAHLGFAVWQADGLHLLNASMIHKRVVLEPMTLRQYLQKHPSHTGIRIVRIHNE